MINQNIKLVLASKSPRRKELLELAGFNFRIYSSNVEESFPADLNLVDIPQHISRNKAQGVKEQIKTDELIIAADTIVARGSQIYGKPKDRDDAIHILQELSGVEHQVITGVCLLSSSVEKCFAVSTKVIFNELTAEEIGYYVDTFNPYDKAGAYAIQEWIGLIGIKKIEGCYFNVVGLPVSRVYQELTNF